MSTTILSEKKFADLILPDSLKIGIASLGVERMTQVQDATIPSLLQGRNVAGAAKTGSGKTLAFLIPGIKLLLTEYARKEPGKDKCHHKPGFRASDGAGVVILSPTRELAMQTFSVADEVMTRGGISQTRSCIIGGDPRPPQLHALRAGSNLIVATPGRLLDFMTSERNLRFDNTRLVVIDEADKCLDQGFQKELAQILAILGKNRPQVAMFSATQNEGTQRQLGDIFQAARFPLTDVEYIGVDDESDVATVEGLDQGYVVVQPSLRFRVLFTFIKRYCTQKAVESGRGAKKVIVFFSSCAVVRFYTTLLNQIMTKQRILSLHGDMKQKQRTAVYEAFQRASTGVLFATDVAARGLDIHGIDWVVQMDPPGDPKAYIHRVGRACRGVRASSAHALLILNAPVGGKGGEPRYLDLLRELKVTLTSLDLNDEKLSNVNLALISLVRDSYDLHKQAKEAFTAYIHSYASYPNKDVFDLSVLDLNGLALSFGLEEPPRVSIGNISRRERSSKRHGALARSKQMFSASNPTGVRSSDDKR